MRQDGIKKEAEKWSEDNPGGKNGNGSKVDLSSRSGYDEESRSCWSWFTRKKPKPVKNNAGNESHDLDCNHSCCDDDSAYSMVEPDGTASAFFESFLPLFLPVVCRITSKSLVEGGCILKNEVPVTAFDEHTLAKDLPIGPIKVSIGKVLIVDRKTMKKDLARGPDFEWPEKERLDSLMRNIPGRGRQMLVLDIVDFVVTGQLGKDIELTFPSNIPLVGNLEVGAGGHVDNACIKMNIKRLRIFFSSETQKCYAVFMARPILAPSLHVNADRGNGDFLTLYIKEEGALENIVETILAGFGPKQIMEKERKSFKKSKTKIAAKIGIAIGKFISNRIQKSIPSVGYTNSPMVVDLSDSIIATIDGALGKPRPVDEVKAHIELLNKELELSIKAEEEMNNSTQSDFSNY